MRQASTKRRARGLGLILMLSVVLTGCDGVFTKLMSLNEARILDTTLEVGEENVFLQIAIDDAHTFPPGKMKFQGGFIDPPGGEGDVPTEVHLFLSRLDANGRVADEFQMTIKLNGNFMRATNKKFQGMDFNAGDIMEMRIEPVDNAVVAGSTVAYQLDYKPKKVRSRARTRSTAE